MSVNGSAPVAENLTSWAVTPTLSELVQRMVAVRPGVSLSPLAGELTETVGGVVSTAAAAIVKVASLLSPDWLPAASRATTRITPCVVGWLGTIQS